MGAWLTDVYNVNYDTSECYIQTAGDTASGQVNVCATTAVTAFGPPDPCPLDTANLTTDTRTALSCLQTAVQNAPGTFTVTSAHRPADYQSHIRASVASAVGSTEYKVGERIRSLEGIDFAKSTRTLVAFVETNCQFCVDSTPLYRAVADVRDRVPNRLQFIAAGVEPIERLRAFVARYLCFARTRSPASPFDSWSIARQDSSC